VYVLRFGLTLGCRVGPRDLTRRDSGVDPSHLAVKRTYLLMDLFARCGGMTRGFVDSGRFTPVFAVECDQDAAATYAANFGDDHVRAVPIEEIEEFPEVDGAGVAKKIDAFVVGLLAPRRRPRPRNS
jgi:hypothetical protein